MPNAQRPQGRGPDDDHDRTIAEDRGGDRQRHGRPSVLRTDGGLRHQPRVRGRDVLRRAAAGVRSRQPDEILRAPRRRAPEAGLPEVVRRKRDHAARRRPGDGNRSRPPGRPLAAGARDRLRHGRAGDRLGAVRSAKFPASTKRACSSTARSRTWSRSSPTRARQRRRR